jgi:hypothetical protein
MKCLLLAVAVSVSIFTFVRSAFTQTWTQTSAPMTNWSAVASSADGARLLAAVSGGRIYTSTNSGARWTATSAPSTNWSAVASSADGSKLVAVVNGGGIHISPDAGVTWTAADAPKTNWSAVATSADGNKLVAVVGGTVAFLSGGGPPGPIYRSTDSGATWTPTSVLSANCTSVSASSDGSKLVAVEHGGPLYVSRDSGGTWEELTPSFAYLVSVAASADGTRIAASTYDPFHSGGSSTVYVSTNSGATWDPAPAGGSGRGYVAASADGTRLVKAGGVGAFGNGGAILTSADSGATWTENVAPAVKWSSVASSADGGNWVATVNGGGVYTSQSILAPFLSITTSAGDLVLSWTVPSTSFGLQQNSNLSGTTWTDVPETPALNYTNLKNQTIVPLLTANRFYRLKHETRNDE